MHPRSIPAVGLQPLLRAIPNICFSALELLLILNVRANIWGRFFCVALGGSAGQRLQTTTAWQFSLSVATERTPSLSKLPAFYYSCLKDIFRPRMSDLPQWRPLRQFPAKAIPLLFTRQLDKCSSHFHRTLVIGACHLMQTRICPQAPESYIFLLPWTKVELTHLSLSAGGLSLSLAYPWSSQPCSLFVLALFPISAPSTLMDQCSHSGIPFILL